MDKAGGNSAMLASPSKLNHKKYYKQQFGKQFQQQHQDDYIDFNTPQNNMSNGKKASGKQSNWYDNGYYNNQNTNQFTFTRQKVSYSGSKKAHCSGGGSGYFGAAYQGYGKGLSQNYEYDDYDDHTGGYDSYNQNNQYVTPSNNSHGYSGSKKYGKYQSNAKNSDYDNYNNQGPLKSQSSANTGKKWNTGGQYQDSMGSGQSGSTAGTAGSHQNYFQNNYQKQQRWSFGSKGHQVQSEKFDNRYSGGSSKAQTGSNANNLGGYFDKQSSQQTQYYDKQKNIQNHQSSNQNSQCSVRKRPYICYVCKSDLKDQEKDFYPCNCKYQICYGCYYHQVEHKERKCPNCGKHYEVNRVEEYKQNRMNLQGSINCCGNSQQMAPTVSNWRNNSKFSQPQVSQSSNIKDKDFHRHNQVSIETTEAQKEGRLKNGKHHEPKKDSGINSPTKLRLSQGNNKQPPPKQMYVRKTPQIRKVEQVLEAENQNQSQMASENTDEKADSQNKEELPERKDDSAEQIFPPSSETVPPLKVPVENEQNKIEPKKQISAEIESDINPFIPIEQNPSKIKTDEDLPIKFQESEKLIQNDQLLKGHFNENFDHHEATSHLPTVQQKYDLVSKNQDLDENDIDQNLQNCKFQNNVPEPIDSEFMENMSMKSSQTLNTINNRLTYTQSQIQDNLKRRTNSQENAAQSQFLQQASGSQGGFSMYAGFNNQSHLSSMNISMKNLAFNQQKSKALLLSSSNVGSVQGQQQSNTIKGIKLSKIRIIQKNTVYIIGLSPQLADESLMRRYEYFGQYGKIKQITLNKDNAYNYPLMGQNHHGALSQSHHNSQGGGGGGQNCAESTSSNKSSQISFAAYITYTSPQDASSAILALDQHQYDGRMIRASYGRTKYCKFFLKNTQCLNKECPYQHRESKEQDILTPDDMQKKALFQYCQQLAIQVSKLTDMTESQFRNLLKHKRESLCHQNNPKHILPKIESIFDQKDIMKKVNLIKQTLKSNMLAKKNIGAMIQEQLTLRIDNHRKISYQELNSSDKIVTNVLGGVQQTQKQLQNSKKQNPALSGSGAVAPSKTKKAKENNTSLIYHEQQQSQSSINLLNTVPSNQQVKSNFKVKGTTGGTQQQAVVDGGKQEVQNIQCSGSKTMVHVVNNQPRSGSHRQNHREDTNRHMLEEVDEEVIKAIGSHIRRPNIARSNSYSRMLSQQKMQIQLEDIKKKHQNQEQVHDSQKKQKQNGKINEFMVRQQKKFLQQSLNNLQTNALKKSMQQTQAMKNMNMENNLSQEENTTLAGQPSGGHGCQTQGTAERRSNRLISKEEIFTQNQVDEDQKDSHQPEQIRKNRGAIVGASGNRLYDRRKSVSKSIQRQNSLSSLVDYTLKFLNDDMAITKTIREQEPLIEKSMEEDFMENQSQINRMIFQNQMMMNNLNQIDQDQYDAKSNYFSNGDSRGHQGGIEINLKKVNSIYTSPFFLINSKNLRQNINDNVYQIWERWENIDHAITSQNFINSLSDRYNHANQFDTYSHQDCRMKSNTLLMPQTQQSNNNINQSKHSLNNNSKGIINKDTQQSNINLNNQQMQRNVIGFYNQNNNNNKQQTNQKSQQSTQLNLTAEPFIKTNTSARVNCLSTSNSNYGNYGQQQLMAQQQHINNSSNKWNSDALLQGCQSPYPGACNGHQSSIVPPIQGQNQSSNNKIGGAVGVNQFKELNEKNLYLFNKQQDELFDKHYLWNKIFLPINHPEGGATIQHKATTDSGQGANGIHNQCLLTSQSVFCFPMGIQDDSNIELEQRKKLNVDKPEGNKGQKQVKQMSTQKNHRNSIDGSDNFDVFKQKRKSMYVTQDQHINLTQINSSNFTPKKESTLLGGFQSSQAAQLNAQKNSSCKPSKPSFTQAGQSKNQQVIPNNNNDEEIKTNINNEFDRKSAGARFASSAYHEFIKVNNVFSTGVCNVRRNSCSKSQSHSRVRMQPSIYHQDDQEEEMVNPINLKLRMQILQGIKENSGQYESCIRQESLGSLLSPFQYNDDPVKNQDQFSSQKSPVSLQNQLDQRQLVQPDYEFGRLRKSLNLTNQHVSAKSNSLRNYNVTTVGTKQSSSNFAQTTGHTSGRSGQLQPQTNYTFGSLLQKHIQQYKSSNNLFVKQEKEQAGEIIEFKSLEESMEQRWEGSKSRHLRNRSVIIEDHKDKEHEDIDDDDEDGGSLQANSCPQKSMRQQVLSQQDL